MSYFFADELARWQEKGIDMKSVKEGTRRKIDGRMPFDHVFWVNGREELCHATGYEVFKLGVWWNEFEDSNGEFQLGR